jgi:hypothetical protein
MELNQLLDTQVPIWLQAVARLSSRLNGVQPTVGHPGSIPSLYLGCLISLNWLKGSKSSFFFTTVSQLWICIVQNAASTVAVINYCEIVSGFGAYIQVSDYFKVRSLKCQGT